MLIHILMPVSIFQPHFRNFLINFLFHFSDTIVFSIASNILVNESLNKAYKPGMYLAIQTNHTLDKLDNPVLIPFWNTHSCRVKSLYTFLAFNLVLHLFRFLTFFPRLIRKGHWLLNPLRDIHPFLKLAFAFASCFDFYSPILDLKINSAITYQLHSLNPLIAKVIIVIDDIIFTFVNLHGINSLFSLIRIVLHMVRLLQTVPCHFYFLHLTNNRGPAL